MAINVNGVLYVPYVGEHARLSEDNITQAMETLPGRIATFLGNCVHYVVSWISALIWLLLITVCGTLTVIGLFHFIDATHPAVRHLPKCELISTYTMILIGSIQIVIALFWVGAFILKISRVYFKKNKGTPAATRKGLAETFRLMRESVKERAVPGSTPADGEMPKFQFEICCEDGTPIGQGFRADVMGCDMLITAAHNLDDLMMIRTARGSVVVKRDDFVVRPLSDVAFLPMVGSYGCLALSKAKLSYRESNQAAMIYAYGKNTIGMVEDMSAFGLVSYTGTTLNGYSGAPYYFGNAVFGIHCGSASGCNFGVEASYLDFAFQDDSSLSQSSCDEDTWDWIEKKLTEGDKMQWRTHPGNAEMILVKYKGRYIEVDTDTEVGDRILKRLSKHEERASGKTPTRHPLIFVQESTAGKTAAEKPVQPQVAKIPQKELPQIVVPTYSDQSAGSFLGQRPLLLRKETSECQTQTMPLPTPQTPNSATAGPTPERKPRQIRLKSTSTSHPKQGKKSERRKLIESLLSLYASSKAGDQQKILEVMRTSASIDGLTQLLTELSLNSTTKPGLATAV